VAAKLRVPYFVVSTAHETCRQVSSVCRFRGKIQPTQEPEPVKDEKSKGGIEMRKKIKKRGSNPDLNRGPLAIET
jgi:hypothetical protein